MTTNSSAHDNTKPSFGWAIFFLLFGAYLIAGAGISVRDGTWPWFMPPQFDFFALLFSIFGERSAAYGGAAVLVLVGGMFLYLGVWIIVKEYRAA